MIRKQIIVRWDGITIGICFSLCVCFLLIGSMCMAEPKSSEAYRLEPVDGPDVKIGGEVGRRIDVTVRNNLLALDVEKEFLQPFRDKKVFGKLAHARRYVGLGKLIDALVSFSVYTKDPKVIALKDHVVDELLKTQLSDGYIGIFQPKDRVTAYWDLHEMVYIVQALVADYEQFDNKASLEAARKLADYIIKHRKSTDPPRKVGKLNQERAFIALTRATGDQKYLDYAVSGMDLRNWSDPVQGHAYTFMNVCLSQLDLYRIKPNQKLLQQSRNVMDKLLSHNALYVSGTCSRREGFHWNQRLDGAVGETCATAYLIRLLHTMLCVEGNPKYGDIMERAIYNALFAAQLPEGRRLRYFTPHEGKRPVYKYDTYCCPNNFRRIVAELPSMVYYTSKGGLVINLYTPSSADVSLGNDLNVAVRQETDYPNSGKVVIHLDPSRPARFPLKLRIPAWCKNPTVSINGQIIEQPVSSGIFCVIDRLWEPGDRITLDMPMTWRLVRGRKLQKGRVAVLRGPMLFCLDPKRLVAMNPDLFNGPDQTADGQKGPKGQKARAKQLSEMLKGLRLDPRSLGKPVKDDTVRPDGLACPIKAWSPKTPITSTPDLNLLLTEFADPSGEATYFLVPDLSVAEQDELLEIHD